MQFPILPSPLITQPLSQDIAAKVVPHVQAAAPIIARAVDPSPKSERARKNRSNQDRAKGGARGPLPPDDEQRGQSVDIDV